MFRHIAADLAAQLCCDRPESGVGVERLGGEVLAAEGRSQQEGVETCGKGKEEEDCGWEEGSNWDRDCAIIHRAS